MRAARGPGLRRLSWTLLLGLCLLWAPAGFSAAAEEPQPAEGGKAVEVEVAPAPSEGDQPSGEPAPNAAEAAAPNAAEAAPPGQAPPEPPPDAAPPAMPPAEAGPTPEPPPVVGPPAPPEAERQAPPVRVPPVGPGAGNVADQTGAGAPDGVNAAEGRGEQGDGAPPDQVRTGPPAPREGPAGGTGYELTPEERARLGLPPEPRAEPARPDENLPPFAEEQPGFIPDTEPGDLFAQPQTLDLQFDSPLPPSALPGAEVQGEIERRQSVPAAGLEDNFARIVVPNGTIQGSTDTKQFHIEGGLLVYYSQVQITGESADIDEKNEMAIIRGNVVVADPEYTMKADELRVYFKDKQMQAKGFVQFTKAADSVKSRPNFDLDKKDRLREYFAGQQFEMYCTDLFYNWETKELSALNSVRLVQPTFNGTMERIDYNDKDKTYEISGTVVLEVTKYDWIFENRLTDDKDEQRVRAITDSPTKITCDRMSYSEESGIAQFYATARGQVTFAQSVRKVTANFVEINDKTKDFYAEGTAQSQAHYSQTDGKWLFEGGLLEKDKVSEDLAASLEGQLDATADTLVFNFDRRRLELKGNSRVVAGERELTAEEVIQDETAKFFLMRGNVSIKDGTKNTVYAAQVYADTENDVFTFVGLVQGLAKSDLLPAAEDLRPGDPGFQAAQGVGQAVLPGGAGGANVAEGR